MGYHKKTQAEREAEAKELQSLLTAQIAGLDTESRWEEMLVRTYQFHGHYSMNNLMLILAQAEQRGFEPTMLRTFRAWKELGRNVLKGQTSIKIWKPIKRRPTEDEVARWAAQGRQVRRDADGRPSIMVVGFGVESIFDISQTDGEPVEVPEPQVKNVRVLRQGVAPELLTGEDTTGAMDAVIALIEKAGYTYSREISPRRPTANGVTFYDTRMVTVRDDVDPAQALKTSVHELAHISCGHEFERETEHQGRRETEAESVAFIVCHALGLDTTKYSAPYVQGWSKGDMTVVSETAASVVRVASKILSDLDEIGQAADGEAGAAAA